MYMFPRQFGLHNAFTSKVDPKDTVQPFKDYTLRAQEIALKFGDQSERDVKTSSTKETKRFIPKRLRGSVERLVRKMQKLHARCAYTELLKYYCPDVVC